MKLFSFGRHFSVSSSTFDANLIRNIGIIAHIDAGKTTTTEKLIYKTGLIKRAGSVDNGDTVMDYLPEERERGITITSAAITLPWRGHRLNLIDTPGHVDFTVEVERSLRVMDAVIVILDASKGVQAQTLTVWRQAQRYGLKSLVFINKMDKVGVDLEKCLKDIQTNFGLAPMLLSEPVMERDEIKGTRLVSGADGLFESVAQYDDEFLEKYLNDVIEPSDCKNAIARITAKGREAIAVLVGASARDIGTENLLDAIVDYLPPPVVKSAVNSNNFKALAFKVVYDQQRNGFLVYCRVYSGEFNSKKKPTLYNLNQKRREQVGKVMQVMADELIEIEGAQVAQVVILTGLKHTATGDTLCDSEDSAEILEGIAIPSPVISVSLEAESPGVQDHLDKCLKTLQLEDPSLRVKTDKATGQTVLSGMGELHLEIAVESRLRKVMKAQFTTGPIAIAYLESLEFFEGEIMKRSHIVERDIFGIKLKGSVDLEIRKSDTFGIEFPARYVNDENVKKSIEDGVYGALGRGPIGGHAVDRNFIVRIENLEFETVNSAHVVVYESLQLLLKAAHSTGKLILKEPLVQVEIDSPEQFIGDLTTDLFSQRRCVDCETLTTTSEDESSTTIRIKARAPLKRMLGYSNWQRSRTGGLASFTMEACGYTASE